MQRQSFWELVQLLKEKGGDAYWGQNTRAMGSRPVSEQVAVALYIIGSQGILLLLTPYYYYISTNNNN
jgi:hypothetical protein